MNQQNLELPIHWHFVDDEIQDLPANATVGPKFSSPGGLPLPNKEDLVSFDGIPDVLFLVAYRHFQYGRDSKKPVSVHLHLSRLGAPNQGASVSAESAP